MPNLSYDGQSFILDGRRIWLVSGAIHYPRVPRELWRDRIRAAKQAGLNCIETYVFWNLHETRPGVFNFVGDADLRQFVQLIADEGMFCILRPGPYICAEWDFGGLPAWLHRVPGVALRQASGPFLEACARYLGAVMDQVRDLQVTTPAPPTTGSRRPFRPSAASDVIAGGPILMVQVENEWFCHSDAQHDTYLRELVRYLRENGCNVPINNCNNLWQRIDGTIDTWNAVRSLAADLRQLHQVQPDAPRIVSEFWTGWYDRWGAAHSANSTAELNLYRLAQVLAAGAQYNLYMFHGGTNFGFWGGRSIARPSCYVTTSYDYDAPLTEAGGRGDKYRAVKRISTFASQFGHVFAHVDAAQMHSAVALDESEHGLSVIDQTGSQGQVIFIFQGANGKTEDVKLMLPDGLTLPVPLGGERVAWLLLKANLGGIAELTYTNLRPWAFVNRQMLVLYGPAGAEGLLSINDAQLTVRVPEGHDPLVERHEELTLVVLNTEQVDAAYVTETGLVIGASAIDSADQPVALAGWREVIRVAATGEVSRSSVRPARAAKAPALNSWQRAALDDWISGAAGEYQPVEGPASLEALNCDYGYGWYRLNFRGSQRGLMLAPEAGDRLHVFSRGKFQALLGEADGATDEPVQLKLEDPTVVLADNLGRFNFGHQLGERKGLFGHVQVVKAVKLPHPQVSEERAPNPFVLSGFILHMRAGERPMGTMLRWKVKPLARKAMIFEVRDLPYRAMLIVNDQPVGLYAPSDSAGFARFVLHHDRELKTGNNQIALALFQRIDAKKDVRQVEHAVRLYQAKDAATAAAQWSFARWRVPGEDAFAPLARVTPHVPCWYRAHFNVRNTDQPLWLEPRGMSKGQIILNDRNVGRYFVATAEGKAVPPQRLYYLPEPWLRTDGPNELLLFDEHGNKPANCRLVYNPMRPYGKD